MSVVEAARTTVDPPTTLPVSHLSISSLIQLMKCPLAWKRKHLDHDPEPSSGKMVLGSACHAALAQHYASRLETGDGLTIDELLDQFSDEWSDRTGREEVDFEKEAPGALLDSGVAVLRIYFAVIAPTIVPVAVERKFELFWQDVEWSLVGVIDLEDADELVRDSKITAKRISQPSADGDLQATVELAARRAEGNPAAGFRFDTLLRQSQPKVEIVETDRTDRQLDSLTDRIFGLAREIEWRCDTGIWSGASPHTWFCGSCRYHDCPLRLG